MMIKMNLHISTNTIVVKKNNKNLMINKINKLLQVCICIQAHKTQRFYVQNQVNDEMLKS